MNDNVVRWINGLSADRALEEFRKCCGATWWCGEMARARPYADGQALVTAADEAFDRMPRDGWLEAFASHPKIGDLDSLRMRFAGNKQWSSGEQAGVAAADEATLVGLAEGNRLYEERFGYIFIICATGLSAGAMLAKLQQRLSNSDGAEIKIAGEQQRKITHLRLNKLIVPDVQAEEDP